MEYKGSGRPAVFGVDVGGVITCGRRDGEDTFFQGDYLRNPRIGGSFDGLRTLVEDVFGPENSCVISKCGTRVEFKTKEWMKAQNFFEQTGMDPTHLYFCLIREGKAPIAKELGITHFVDDRLDVLGCLADVGVDNLYLFNTNLPKIRSALVETPGVSVVQSWPKVVETIRRDLGRD